MGVYLYSSVEKEKRELTKWYNELMQSLSGKELECSDADFEYDVRYVELDDREYKRRIEGFTAVKKDLLKLSPLAERPTPQRVDNAW